MKQDNTNVQTLGHKPLSRRDFLKAGCIGATAIGATICGLGAAIPAPEQTPVDLPSPSFGDDATKQRILIAYASFAGSTAEVAIEIGKALSSNGISVDVRPVKANPPISGYDAVFIGSAVHYGQWLQEATDFVKANQEALRCLPVSLFTVHITHLEDTEENRKYRLSILDSIRLLVQPVSEAYFAGKFDRRGAAQLLPGLIAKFIPPMDRRDWKKIREWAEDIEL